MAKPTGKLALVTGASGGIGEAFAIELARRGHDVALVARSGAKLEALGTTLAAEHGITAHAIPLDLAAAGAGDALEAALTQKGLQVDLLINNAGYGLMGPFAKLDRDDQLQMIDLNVRTLTDLAHRFMQPMIARRSGGIINVASVASFMPGPNMAVYYATKAFVRSLSEALSEELKGTGVRVTALCPGPVMTGFQARADMGGARLFKFVQPTSAAMNARAALDALKSGRRVVVPGLGNRISVAMVPFSPRGLVLRMVRTLQSREK